MEDDEMFGQFGEIFNDILSEETIETARLVSERWLKIGELLTSLDLSETRREVDWLQAALGDLGININALLLLGLKIAVTKNIPPMDFSSTYTSGYVLGYLSALEDRGEDPFGQLEAARPEPSDDDDHDVTGLAPVGLMRIETKKYEDDERLGIDEIGEHLRETARKIGQDFTEPDDDWAPVLLVACENEISLINFDMPDDETKNMLMETVIPRTVKATMPPAQVVGFIVSAWTLMSEDGTPIQRPPKMQIRDHPDRRECLILYLMDRAGEVQMWSALILRDDKHAPGLGEWTKHDLDLTTGRVANMLRKIVS